MKIFALGGYGKTGLPAIELLAQHEWVTEIAIVGRNRKRADTAATAIGKKAIAVCADGTDEGELATLAADYDLIMNIASNESVLPAIHAAIRSGTHYCDESWGEILDKATALTDAAKAAGTTAIVANGISPCISNLMGVHVAGQLDKVEQLQIGRADIFNFDSGRELTPQQWHQDPRESLAALDEFRPFITWMLQRLQKNGVRKVLERHDGQWTAVDPVKQGVEVPFLQGDRVTAYPYGCADDLWGMLPRDLAHMAPVEMWFSPFPPQTHALLRKQALRVVEDKLEHDKAIQFFFETIEHDPHRWLTLPDDFDLIAKIWVRAVGEKDGRAARHTCWFTAPMWPVGGYFLTSVALVAAARKILRSEINERGVFTAEKAFAPQSFFAEVVDLLPEPPPGRKMIDESGEWLA